MRTVTKTKSTLPAAFVSALLILTGCSSGGDGPEVEDLATVVSAAPSGFTEVADDSFGEFDIEAYLENFADDEAEERAQLEEAGFTRGFARGYVRNAQDAFLAVFVFETKSSGAAKTLLNRSLEDGKADGGVDFDVDGIKGAKGQSSTDEEGTAHVVAFTRGKRVYLVAGQFQDDAESRSGVVSFAKTQDDVAR